MLKSNPVGNRELPPRGVDFKREMEELFLDYEVQPKEYKDRIAKTGQISVQYVRKWFREKRFVNEDIEKAAWAELAKAKLEFDAKAESRVTKLKKLN
tara:strand:- start:60072 stop:60362 length:291 start_codon:yes stop_codon:yes gene_type:complete